ncbi:MAG: Rrf2 family transcriptional regulator [Actinomycetota bacterium]|nr:Rrf2 family transcriptional regulator [Actinomycetota bacterium]
MRISTRARYGLRLMVEIALSYKKGPILLKEISKNIDVSEKYLSQIIIPLKGKSLVNTYSGAHSGYVLSRPPSEIKLKEIVEILEGDSSLIDCVNNPSVCNRVSACVTRDIWTEIGDKISEILSSYTLGDLAKMCMERKDDGMMYSI